MYPYCSIDGKPNTAYLRQQLALGMREGHTLNFIATACKAVMTDDVSMLWLLLVLRDMYRQFSGVDYIAFSAPLEFRFDGIE